jgi:hypothetical protein
MKKLVLKYSGLCDVISCYDNHNHSLCDLRKRIEKTLNLNDCDCILTSAYYLGRKMETVIMINSQQYREMKIHTIQKGPDEITEEDIINMLIKPLYITPYKVGLILK